MATTNLIKTSDLKAWLKMHAPELDYRNLVEASVVIGPDAEGGRAYASIQTLEPASRNQGPVLLQTRVELQSWPPLLNIEEDSTEAE